MDQFEKQSVPNASLDPATRDHLAPASPPPPVAPTAVFEGSFFDRNKWYVIVSALAIFIIAILGYFALRRPAAPEQPKVSVALEVPANAPSGAEIIAKVLVTNNDTKTITKGTLELVYPSGVTFVSANPQPENLSGTVFSLPDVPAGINVAVLIKVRLEGNVGSQLSFIGTLKYRIAGLSADFSAEAKGVVQVTAAGAGISVEGPREIANASVVSYTVSYSNQGTSDLKAVRVKLVTPQGFQFAQSEPDPSQGTDTWDITPFPVGAQGTIRVSGTFSGGQPGQSYTFLAQLLVPDANGQYYVQTEGQYTTAITNQPLLVTQAVEGVSATETPVLKAGDTVQYALAYKNNATVVAKAVRIVFSIDSAAADLSSIQAEGGSISGNTVTFTAAGYSALESVSPGDSGEVSVSFRLRNPLVNDRTTNPKLVTNVKITSNEYDSFLPGNSITADLSTEVRAESALVHVSGPLPPRVGQQTSYTVKISLRNTTSDVRQNVFTAVVASGVTLDKTALASDVARDLTYDQATGRISWRFDTLSAHSGSFLPVKNVELVVRVTPPAAAVGKPLKLLRELSLKGADTGTGKAVQLSMPDISSADVTTGTNDGVVVQ